MVSTITDRLYGESSGVAVKAPVVAVASAAISLNGLGSIPTGAGTYAPNPGDRVLVANQADPTANGIYNASASAWQRAGDMDGAYDVVQGTLVVANLGNGQGLLWQLTSPNPIYIGSSPLTFTPFAPTYPQQINILNYGADPTGVNDSYPAINAAVNAAVAAGGGIVYYPAGTFMVSASIPDVAAVTHQGSGFDATTVQAKANTNFPVFSRAGSATVTINGGGIRDMRIVGAWLSTSPTANTTAHCLSIVGSNGAIYQNLRLESGNVGCYLAFNYESYMDNVKTIAGPGVNLQQCATGFLFDATTTANVNNAMYMTNCQATFTWGDAWRVINANGSIFDSCSGEAPGQSGISGYSWNIGSSSPLAVACRFAQWESCVGDSAFSGNWIVQGGALSRTTGAYDLFFDNCWSGQCTNSPGWAFVNVLDASVTGSNSDSADQNAMLLSNSPITVTGFIARNFNTSGGGYAGINLLNTVGANITGCDLRTDNGTGGSSTWGIAENGTSNFNNIQCNTMLKTTGATALSALIVGANTTCRDNIGFVTESAGSVTINASSTTAVVNHGLGLTPNLGEIALTVGAQLTGGIAFVTNATGAQFTINIPSQASNVTIGWQAHILRH